MAQDHSKKEMRPRSMFDELFDVTKSKSIFETMDQLFADAFGGGTLPVSQYETKTHYHIEASLPGVAKEEIDIELNGDSLKITVDKRQTLEDEKRGKRSSKREFQERTIPLPEDILRRDMKAQYENGVLKIAFPKKRGKKIEIE
ncbi:Hsp20/alpha crystallin family protein [Pontibacillus salicampi]|uniref:Hsp20/alpha crystallin family protein n=1 Tax=Pontibacillus salicampi TaxID=1449801 RepID=A0ABV6LQM2_9BACI